MVYIFWNGGSPDMDHCSGQKGTLDTLPIVAYSHLFDKRGGGAKVAKSLNVEVG